MRHSWLRETFGVYLVYLGLGLAVVPFALIFALLQLRKEEWFVVILPLIVGSAIALSIWSKVRNPTTRQLRHRGEAIMSERG